MTNGLIIKGVNCEVKNLQIRDYVVSFMHLPTYLDDNNILGKLEGWEVNPILNKKKMLHRH